MTKEIDMDAAQPNDAPETAIPESRPEPRPEPPAPAYAVADPYRPVVPPLPATGVRQVKLPWLALFLSVMMPGLGQIYNGQVQKALVFFFGFVGCIWLTIENGPPLAMAIPFIYFYSLIDAWQSAARINERAAGNPEATGLVDENSPAWGMTLVGLGIVFLLRNLGWISMAWLQRWWPLLLVAAGASFVYRSMQRSASHVQD